VLVGADASRAVRTHSITFLRRVSAVQHQAVFRTRKRVLTSLRRRQARQAWFRRRTPATSLGWPAGCVGCEGPAWSTRTTPFRSGRVGISVGTGILGQMLR
jgi:hypothetical protein